MCKTKVLVCNLASASTWWVRRGVLYRYTYYAVNMYNEVRERRVKRRGGSQRAEGGNWGNTRRSRRRRKADNTCQGQAVFKCDRRCCRCLHGETFLQTTMAAGQPSFFFHLRRRASTPSLSALTLLLLTPLPPSFSFRYRRRRHRRCLLEHRPPREPTFARKKSRSTAVYHRGLLLIVIKYSSTVTRGKFSWRTPRSILKWDSRAALILRIQNRNDRLEDYFECYGVLKTYFRYFIVSVKMSSNDPRPSIMGFRNL